MEQVLISALIIWAVAATLLWLIFWHAYRVLEKDWYVLLGIRGPNRDR